MTGQELRQRFLKFFERNGHLVIPSASLVPSEEEQLAGKEKVLFTSAGMQPLIPYLTGKKEPPSKKLADVQKCLRTDDIEEVGDEVHHTFFEMLGNWSIGDYWKEEAIKLSFEFLTKELEIPIEKLAVTVFAGDEDAPRDEESAGVWKNLGIPEERIFYFGKSHNWWPTARQEQDSGEYKNPFGPCGPDTEMFYWTGEGQPEGKPNEDSRWVEIWNDVFMQFNRKEGGILEDLPQRNVDTGMGLERTLAVLNGKKSDYETDLFEPIIKIIENVSGKRYSDIQNQSAMRVIVDHLRAALFLIADGIEPSNKKAGYILRRLIRRASLKTTTLQITEESHLLREIVFKYSEIMSYYREINDNKERILHTLQIESEKFNQTQIRGLKEFHRRADPLVKEKKEKNLPFLYFPGIFAFHLHDTFGFPPELTDELAKEVGLSGISWDDYRKEYQKHQAVSRTASAGMFKGGLADQSEIVTKYHTATHLLHQALRDVLGPQVFQKGSNITSERLRFDFSFDRKMTDEEIKQTEDILNKRIEEDLKVERKIVSPQEAKEIGAIGLFDEKYGNEVSIYGIGPDFSLDPKAKDQRERGGYYSLEFCGGPHVEHIGIIGKIKITKEEVVSAGVRRIRAQIV